MVALFKDHYFETIELLSEEQRENIKNNDKDYIVLDVQCTNNGAWIDLELTNDFPEERFENGECCVFNNDTFSELLMNYEYQTGKNFYEKA